MTTIRDIAKKMNLHFTTVSKALQDHPDISAATKEKVRAVAKELDYQPNLLAKSFKQKKSNTIGIIVPSINYDFAAAIISGVEEIINNAGYTLTICQTNESIELEKLHIQRYITNQVEGVLIQVTAGDDSIEHLKKLRDRNIELVIIDRKLKNFTATTVVVDDYKSSFDIVEHLIHEGYVKIAHFGGPEHLSVSIDRRKGYTDALQKHNISIDQDLIIHGGFYEEYGEQSMKTLLAMDKKPDAVFCANDAIAAGVYVTLNSLGLKIPSDVAVAGFGNMSISRLLHPPLTTVNQFAKEMGRVAAESLIELLKHDKKDSSDQFKIIETELIIRQSTKMLKDN